MNIWWSTSIHHKNKVCLSRSVQLVRRNVLSINKKNSLQVKYIYQGLIFHAIGNIILEGNYTIWMKDGFLHKKASRAKIRISAWGCVTIMCRAKRAAINLQLCRSFFSILNKGLEACWDRMLKVLRVYFMTHNSNKGLQYLALMF